MTLTQPLKWRGKLYMPIPGAIGYVACTDGTIWSCRKFCGGGYGRQCRQEITRVPRRKLKPDRRVSDKRARCTIKMSNGQFRRAYVARLVLEAFVGPCPVGMECRHLDGNCLNDSISNLAWGTQLQNKADMEYHGTRLRGHQVATARLTESDVKYIRRIGYPLKKHAIAFGVTEAAISAVLRRKTWRHIC